MVEHLCGGTPTLSEYDSEGNRQCTICGFKLETEDKIRDKYGRFIKGNPYAPKPGEIRNPKGRPPNEMSITAQLRKILEENEGRGYETVARSIYKVLKDLDEKHSASILKDAMDRLEGKAPDILTITPDSKITFNVSYEGETKETNVQR